MMTRLRLKRMETARRNGFVLIALAFGLMILLGVLGLTVDLGRMYIAKNELQAYVDAAALAANRELDGTDAGIARARQVASTYPNKWYFRSQQVTSPVVTFAASQEGPYVYNPPSPPVGYRYARVEAGGELPLYFMPSFQASGGLTAPAAVLLGISSRTQIRADSLAGQVKVVYFANNLLPYSPDAHLDPGRAPVYNPGYAAPDPFNFVVGNQYTLRWPPPGQRNKPGSWCAGDREANFVTPSPAQQRGFIDIGDQPGSGGSAYIRQAIVANVQSHALRIGDAVVSVSGNRGVESEALRERVNQDTDNYSRTFSEYLANRGPNGERVGNGRRVVFVPVNNPFDADRIVDFAAFFLPVAGEVCGSRNTDPCCAEYVGAGLLPGRQADTKTVGVYVSKLLE